MALSSRRFDIEEGVGGRAAMAAIGMPMSMPTSMPMPMSTSIPMPTPIPMPTSSMVASSTATAASMRPFNQSQGGGGGGGMESHHHSSSGLTLALPMATPLLQGGAAGGSNPNCCSPLSVAQNPEAAVPSLLPRIKLSDIQAEDGAPSPAYSRAVDALYNSLSRQSAVILELNPDEAALVRCAVESCKLYFRTRPSAGGGGGGGGGAGAGGGAASSSFSGTAWSTCYGYVSSALRDMFFYRAGRLQEVEQPPPGMLDVFRCLGKASRTALGAIARHLRLRNDAFSSLLDDCPLSYDEVSSSAVVATHFHSSALSSKVSYGGDTHGVQEFEKGLLMLIASDNPGLQVCDQNNRWYLADSGLNPGDVLLLTGRALNHITAGLCRACSYRVLPSSSTGTSGRTSLSFRLMPRNDAMLDAKLMCDIGYPVSESYGAISVAQFMEGLTAAEALVGNGSDHSAEARGASSAEQSLRKALSDPLTGALLDDAFTAPGCGHSFGAATMKRVIEAHTCSVCGSTVDRVIPNLALRAAAAAFKQDERKRQLQNANRKRKKDAGMLGDNRNKRVRDGMESPTNQDGFRQMKGVQYPFSVNEKVLIKGNKRTPEKFMGREAIITSQCLNGWYLLKTLDNGESVRLQYRSLQKIRGEHANSGNEESILASQTKN